MPAVNTAEEAANTAESLVAKYHQYRILKRSVREGDRWVVEFEVGILGARIVRVTLDAHTGNVIEYGEVRESGR